MTRGSVLRDGAPLHKMWTSSAKVMVINKKEP